MHGLVNRTIQLFVTQTHGERTWIDVTRRAGLDFTEFESMMRYRETYTPMLLDATAEVLGRARPEVMEDIGTFIVSDGGFEAVRRLLRFGGIDFVDFIQSLDELDERVSLAIPDLRLPKVELYSEEAGQFTLKSKSYIEGYGHVVMGVLRAMADDYGALALLEHLGVQDGSEVVSVRLIETDFAEGRSFDLGARVA